MKKVKFVVVSIFLVSVIAFSNFPQNAEDENQNSFSFVFCTDIHAQHERRAVEGFTQAIDTINQLKPDFVITGGDLIMDALGQTYERADSLYDLYVNITKKFDMPVHNTMGNHEIYGIYSKSGADPSHPEYGEKMYENRLGKSYYSFDHHGWKFIIVNSAEDTKKNEYIGLIDSMQIEWIKEELVKTDPKTPIVISTHIPFITAYAQKYSNSTTANDSALVVVNSKQVIDLFKGYNLKLVLQGHLHTVEDIFIDGVHFITGGAVSAAWWTGPNMGFEEGFMFINVKGEDFDWKYVDYGWQVEK
jgi:3',5'-cyclic AMP phosphodiesterase CpdA